MGALVLKRYARPDQVAFVDTPRPVPKPNEILIQVHAASLNPIDNMIPKGTLKKQVRFRLPISPFASCWRMPLMRRASFASVGVLDRSLLLLILSSFGRAWTGR